MVLAVAVGCAGHAGRPSACAVAVTTTRQEASAVVLPPRNENPGRRAALPTIAVPNIPINGAMIGC